MINLLILIYIGMPFILMAVLAYFGVKHGNSDSVARRVSGNALLMTSFIGLFVYGYIRSSTHIDAWGFAEFGIPFAWIMAIVLVFGIIWSLFVIVSFIDKKLSRDYFIGALIILCSCLIPIGIHMDHKATLSKAYKSELSRKEILHLLDLYKEKRGKSMPEWLRNSLDAALRNPKLPENTLGDFIDYKYFNATSIASHPNITPPLLDKMYEKGYGISDIVQNKKTAAPTLLKMYAGKVDFHTQGWIADHPNAPDEIVVDFINKSMLDKDKDKTYWAISNIDKIPAGIFKKMSKDSDPKMRLAVANNYYAPLDVIYTLRKDSDGNVAYRAKENLRLRVSMREDLKKLAEEDVECEKKEKKRIEDQLQKQGEANQIFLLQRDIGDYKYSEEGNHKLVKSWVLENSWHFMQDHVDTTQEAYYSNKKSDLWAAARVTRHETSDSDMWLLHEIQFPYRLPTPERYMEGIDVVLKKGVTLRDIHGNRIYYGHLGEGNSETLVQLFYVWISDQMIIEILCFRGPDDSAEPIEVIESFLKKYPSSIPHTLILDRAYDIKWMKEEMNRRLWLCEKWSTSDSGSRRIAVEMSKNMYAFLAYREKCYGKKAKDEADIVDSYEQDRNINGLKEKLVEYKKWWLDHIEKGLRL